MEYALLGLFGVLAIVLVARFAPRLGVASPLLLVVVGIATSYIPGVPDIVVPPELILSVVLPPILYSAAVNVPLLDFRRNLKAITGLSVLLVIVSALITGFGLYLILPDLSLPAAIALGAVISPPDAVAATSIGKRLGLPPRLVTVLEGEGLVNDATALVLLRTAIAASAGAVSLGEVAGDFAYAVAAAIVIGIAVGYALVWVRSKLDDPVLNTTLSFTVPFLAFIPAEELNASGVLAVVVAGLITGHNSARYFSSHDRIAERLNWRTAQFVLENGVFLLMGIELRTLVEQVEADDLSVPAAIGLGILASIMLVLIRTLFVIPLIAILRHDQRRARKQRRYLDSALRRLDSSDSEHLPTPEKAKRVRTFLTRKRADVTFLTQEGLGWRGGAVLAWSGMRGVVTLAAAQSLPTDIPYRPQLILIAFTVAVVTLLGNGGTLPLLIRKLGIRGTDPVADRKELAGLIREISRVGLAALDNPDLLAENGGGFDPEVIDRARADSIMRSESVAELRTGEPGPHQQHRTLRLRVLEAERAALLDARATGSYSSRVMERAQNILDLEESRLAQLNGPTDRH
ncbi:CPA1 family monovalent cation:H+ antiporter [Okibacterium sp. HSC-33S16]|uniref:cation:proton antiporter n=1 Tax=Okibacterium sp. HSC-33S16 TaxID=2910965 RepID=UPI0020A19EDF|nr:sodium:proton antiporter [Okibacterium sp. HSC-33S16]MCP2031737.1 CPA1 family monovalent cation:H+ antiporter [Okibacterium sp. HSC-33S16]